MKRHGSAFINRMQAELDGIKEAGTWKNERVITSAMESNVTVGNGAQVLNFCANNYLGLSNDPRITAAAKKTIDERGYGLSSVSLNSSTLP